MLQSKYRNVSSRFIGFKFPLTLLFVIAICGFEASAAAAQTQEKAAVADHVKKAQQLIRQNRLEGFNQERHADAMEHLVAAIEIDPEDVRAKVNLIDLYLTKARSAEKGSSVYIDNLKLGRKWLEELTSGEGFTRLEQVMAVPQLVDVCVKLGDRDAAERALASATVKVEPIAKKNPDVYEVWFSLVQSAVALKDYEQASEFVRTAYQSAKAQETRRKILQLASLIHIQNADDFKDTSTQKNFQFRLFALCKAIESNPRDVKIYDRLVEYIDTDKGGPERDEWLRNSIVECPIPGVVHILIGAREILRGDGRAGVTSWEIAKPQFNSTDFVIHRLLSVAIRKAPKFADSNLLEKAIEFSPDQYMLYETRGAVKKSKGLHKDAIEDFLIVVEKVPDLITANKHLQDCYEAIGDTKKATQYAGTVNELLDKVDQKQRSLYEQVLKKL